MDTVGVPRAQTGPAGLVV